MKTILTLALAAGLSSFALPALADDFGYDDSGAGYTMRGNDRDMTTGSVDRPANMTGICNGNWNNPDWPNGRNGCGERDRPGKDNSNDKQRGGKNDRDRRA